jgi:hypothetical protein
VVSVLAVLSIADINSPSPRGQVSDKLDAYFEQGKVSGFSFSKVLLPGNMPWQVKSAYKFTKLSGGAALWTLSLISLVLKWSRMEGVRKQILEVKSRHLRSEWSKLIELTQAEIVMGIGIPEELLYESNRRGLPTLEVQHGTLNAETLERYFPKSRPSKVLCWNSYTVNVVRELGFDAVNVGHPVSMLVRRTQLRTPEGIGPSNLRRLTFCVALSWKVKNGVGYFGILHSELEAEIEELIAAGHTPVFRIHPVTSSQFLRRFLVSHWIRKKWPGGELHDPKKVSLRESIEMCDFLLSFESATAYEFGVLGKPSILLKPESRNEISMALTGASGLEATFIFDSFQAMLNADFGRTRQANTGFLGVDALFKSLLKPKA